MDTQLAKHIFSAASVSEPVLAGAARSSRTRAVRLLRALTIAAAATVVMLPVPADAQFGRPSRQGELGNRSSIREAYERGYAEGLRNGERDSRGGNSYAVERDRVYRDANRGYENRYGSRDAYRNDFRRGYTEGYRAGYDQTAFRRGGNVRGNRNNLPGRPGSGRVTADPAQARGYSDGYTKGVEDGRDRDRFDPRRHGDYRSADNGYRGDYGSKDAYRDSYRVGFSRGYEEGYQQASGIRVR
jgi:hypothetical protein